MSAGSRKEEFLQAFDEYSDAMFRFAMVKTGNTELSEDVVQDTFMRYWQALREGREMYNTRSYLYTVANHLIIDWYRKKKSNSLDEKMDAGFMPEDAESASTATYAEGREALAALNTLEEADRTVLELRYVEGLLPHEIAEALGETTNVVSVRIHRATKRLRKQMRE